MNPNLIKLKQLDSSVWDYASALFTGSFSSSFTQYLANGGSLGSSIVYSSNVDQNVSGKKIFLTSPGVPFSGATGDAPSRQYVDTQLSSLSSSLLPLVGSQFLYATGDRLISGNSIILGNFYSPSVKNTGNSNELDLFNASLKDNSAASTLNWNTKQLFGGWTFDGHAPVFTDTNQSLAGVKTFITEVVVPTASNNFNPVPFNQFQTALGNSGKYFNDLFNTISKVTSSGFGGILSFNGQSGNIFTQGRGSVTAWQQGNIFNISGAEPVTQSIESLFVTKVSGVCEGCDYQRFDFDNIYDSNPFVYYQISNSSGEDPIFSVISEIDPSGFILTYFGSVPSPNYQVTYSVFDPSGLISNFKGEQGNLGPYLQGKGLWNTGTTYGYLDFVRTADGVSWYSKTGHLSTTGTSPLVPSGINYWELLASGAGPAGQNAVPFVFKGNWTASSYSSGQAVLYNGASYATLQAASPSQPPTGAPWFVVAAKGESGLGFNYKGQWNQLTTYSLADVVKFNGGSYIVTSTSGASGANAGPVSLNTKFGSLVNKPIVYKSNYSASQFYYPNDITMVPGNSTAPIQYIHNGDSALLSLHPYGYYNQFVDCDGFTGYNLIQLTTGVKNDYHPNSGKGDINGFIVNDQVVNDLGSGGGTLVLVRDRKYYFDSELKNCPFIFTTSPSGGNYNGQIVDGVITGNRLSVSTGSYTEAGINQHVASGSLIFTPNSGTPNEIYYQCPTKTYVGWKLKIVDKNPWETFSSGVRGLSITGETGLRGLPGLAFAWKGDWNGGVGYNSGEAVYYSGSSYGTNGSVIGTQPPNSPWFYVAKQGDKGVDARGLAFVWKEIWDSGTQYIPYDSVYYDGSSYATTGSVLGNYPPDIFTEYWFPIAHRGGTGSQGIQGTAGTAFGWQGLWNDYTLYNSGDAVYFEGSSYGTRYPITVISPTGIVDNTWEIFAQKGGTIFSWMGTWLESTVYNSGDAVYHEGSSYATFLNNNLFYEPGISSNWFIIASKGGEGEKGDVGDIGPRGTGGLAFEWRGTWDANTVYAPKDSAFYNGSSYGTLQNITGLPATPPDVSSKWFLVAEKGDPGLAFNWRGTWSNSNIYRPNDAVYYQSRSYGTSNFIAAGIQPNPVSGLWYIIADKGGQDVAYSIYLQGNPNLFINTHSPQVITPYSFTFTGYSVALDNSGNSGNISGYIYSKTISSTGTLANFALRSGQLQVTSGGFNGAVDSMNRIGIIVTSGNLLGASGLTMGIFGFV